MVEEEARAEMLDGGESEPGTRWMRVVRLSWTGVRGRWNMAKGFMGGVRLRGGTAKGRTGAGGVASRSGPGRAKGAIGGVMLRCCSG